MVRRVPPAIVLMAAISLEGCGTHVPDIQESPFATEQQRSDFVQEIVQNVRCELQDAVVKLYARDPPKIDPYNRNLGWFDSWAAQVSLTLTTDEKGVFSPSLSLFPTKVFSLNLGASASSEAQRVDKIGSFFLVADLKSLQACPPAQRGRGPFLLESDLKLFDWLEATMISINNGSTPAIAAPTGPLKSNVLSHEVKFDIITTGGLTPVFKMTRVTVDPTGTLLNISRDRTQDLTITFGPPDPSWTQAIIDPATNKPLIDPKTQLPLTRPVALAPAAASAALAAEIGNAITNGVRNALRQ